jgi:hypothetical protein
LALMLQGFKVAFVAVIAALLALYAPLLSLNAYSTTLSEVVYEGLGYRVTYKSPLIPLTSGDKTNVVLEVKRGGKPVDFGFTLSGITFDGARDVAKGRGHGRASADITGYVDDVVRVLREANSNPAHSGLGLLTFIVSKVEEDGEEYIATDIISIPIVPGKARGKNIVVEVEFKPVHKIKLNKTSGGEQSGKAEVLQTTPPRTIFDDCEGYSEISARCYEWRLNRTLIQSRLEGVPALITFLGPSGGESIWQVQMLNHILLKRNSYWSVSFELSLVFKKLVGVFVAPGPGYYREISSGLNQETLFYLNCYFTNSYLTSELSSCNYMFTQGFRPTPSTFYKEALLAIGFWGYMWLVEYDYVEWPGDRIVDKSLAVYLVPYFNLNNKMIYWYHIDDDPYDGYGLVEKIFRLLNNNEYTSWVFLGSSKGIQYDVTALRLKQYSGSPYVFGISLAVGALALVILGTTPPGWTAAALAALTIGIGISRNVDEFYLNYGLISFEAKNEVTFYPYYVEISRAYTVYEAGGGQYKVPFVILYPIIG